MTIGPNRWTLRALVSGLLLAGGLNAAEAVRFTMAAEVHPVLIRREHNPLVEVRVEVPEDGVRLQRLTFSLAGTDDFSDLELVEVFSPATCIGLATTARGTHQTVRDR